MNRDDVPQEISKAMGSRPVRWVPLEKMVFDYDGRERTLQVFNADVGERDALLKALRPICGQLQEAAGGPLVIIFYSSKQSRQLYGDVLAKWSSR